LPPLGAALSAEKTNRERANRLKLENLRIKKIVDQSSTNFLIIKIFLVSGSKQKTLHKLIPEKYVRDVSTTPTILEQ
jgi:hypothetical protein